VTDLREVVVQALQRRPVTSDVRSRRQRLCEFIRAHEARVYDVRHPRAGEVRDLLGWDDETMAAFISSPLLCHSSPHAAMNSFPPTFAYSWILGRAVRLARQRHGSTAVHVRTQCTHNDFYDTFTKPHAWWHRAPDGAIVKSHLFARRPIKDHPVLSKPAPALDHRSLHPVDRAAVELASLAANYAYYCVIYGLHLERTLDFHVPHRFIEIPIDLLNRFTIAESGLVPWFDAVAAAGQSLRVERDNAPMAILTRPEAELLASSAIRWLEPAVVGSNQVNIAQVYLLGVSLMIGGPKMARYIPQLNPWIAEFAAEIAGCACKQPELVPVTRVPVAELLGLDREAADSLREWGISTSLSLVASAERDRAAVMLEPLLTMDYAGLFEAEPYPQEQRSRYDLAADKPPAEHDVARVS
jgi:hypothetical protein